MDGFVQILWLAFRYVICDINLSKCLVEITSDDAMWTCMREYRHKRTKSLHAILVSSHELQAKSLIQIFSCSTGHRGMVRNLRGSFERLCRKRKYSKLLLVPKKSPIRSVRITSSVEFNYIYKLDTNVCHIGEDFLTMLLDCDRYCMF